ncbi:DUF484 family protein [Acidithiobacillus sp. IBUN Pt1247-S3]|uniref:DUF484 family protein n=1 Tax=Acidithiobacillus sp. IBUN Pt1247-S3 TaxID=3166642 RepID=UPI0034E5CED9
MQDEAAAQCRTYLQAHPEFLVHEPDLLQELTLPHLGVGSASSLLERQVQRLRDERDHLQRCVDNLLDQARRQSDLGRHLSRLAVELLLAVNPDACVAALYRSLDEDFAVESSALLACPESGLLDAIAIDESTWQRLVGDREAQAGVQLSEDDLRQYFPAAEHAPSSVASISVQAQDCRGVILLASQDPERYSADMATDLLEQISRLFSAALHRCSASSSNA